MKELASWSELFFESLQSMMTTFGEALPGIIGAILIVLLGWLFAKIISRLVSRLLKAMRFDDLAEKVNISDYLDKANVKAVPSDLVGKFFYWLILLLVFTTASDTLGWHAVTDEISNLIRLLPKLLVAVVFFLVGTFIATFIRDLIRGTTSSLGIGAGKVIGNAVFYLLFIIVTLTSLEQAGMDTTIITSNLLLILGAIMIAAAISYGFASREILSNILASFFSRRTFKVGQVIEVEGVRGQIIETTNISVTIQTGSNEKTVIPTHQLITNKVKIIG